MHRNVLFAIIACIYLASSLIQFDFDSSYKIVGLGVGWPRVLTGDEPHYLVMVNSLLSDGDLRLLNNYESAIHGESCATGRNHRGRWTDTRIRYFEGSRDITLDVFFVNGSRRLGKEDVDLSKFNEVAIPPFGMPLVVSLFAWPFEGTCAVESVAILVTIFITIIGLYCLFLLLSQYVPEKVALLMTFLCAFATPLWFYARSFYPQAYIASIIMICLYLVVVRREIVIPAIILGVGYLIRYPFVLVIIPFWLYVFFRQPLKKLVFFTIPLIASELVLLSYNYAIFGTIFAVSQRFAVGSPWPNVLNLIVHPTYGLLVFVPVFIFSFDGFRIWFHQDKAAALLGGGIVLVTFFFYALWVNQGGAFGTRYLLDIIPLLFVPVGFWYAKSGSRYRRLFFLLALSGMLINAFAGLFPPLVIGRSPVDILFYVLGKI